ncbi:MAG: HDOD domain-containing protein, partial [Gammaproteobacteria bacterium]|nr:HDOD domain-containing protein [Gammaproteobacteria bacterium]
MEHYFIGRQAIFGRNANVIGYELLFRDSETHGANITDGDQATSQVLFNSCMEVGLDALVGKYPAFINLTRSFLTGASPLPIPPKRVIIEVLEDIEPDQEVINGLVQLSKQGHIIAMDDFVFHDKYIPLLKLAHIVKVDILGVSREDLARQVEQLRPYKVKLLAEKVETYEELEYCKSLDFDYFQGYFICKPQVVSGKGMKSNRLAILKLLSRLQDPTTGMDELEKLIIQDVSLTYRLLRHINSVGYSLLHEIESIQHALQLLGTQMIRNWVSLILLSKIDGKPMELMKTALIRGKHCELLAETLRLANKNQYFTVGLFSALDAIMDKPMAALLAELPLAKEIKSALLNRSGELGAMLQ